MSRFIPLFIFAVWMAAPSPVLPPAPPALTPLCIFLGFYGALILVLRFISQRTAANVHYGSADKRLRRFNLLMFSSKVIVPTWFGVGIYLLGWRNDVTWLLTRTRIGSWPIESPELLLASLPPFLALAGLWWAQFPADRALREQNLLVQLNEDLPIHAPPSFATYLRVNLRLQILFVIAPTLALVLLRDGLSLVIPPLLNHITFLRERQNLVELLLSLPSFILLLTVGPELLRRVLHTQRLPDGPLRDRLIAICTSRGVGFRNILLWQTDHQMSNAAVMGFIPRFRYLLLSDLLLETMNDRQIEAIFAHEVGHIYHRHLWWMILSIAALLLALVGPGQLAIDGLDAIQRHMWMPDTLQLAILSVSAIAVFAAIFGYLSRKFERQADLFAVRTMSSAAELPVLAGAALDDPSIRSRFTLPAETPEEGELADGAAVFCSALQRVALVNNISVAARSWTHGSISSRMEFVFSLPDNPCRVSHFDRFMRWLYTGLVVALFGMAAWAFPLLLSTTPLQ